MKKFDKYRTWVMAFIFVVAVILVYKTFDNFYKIGSVISLIFSALSPFITGFVLAYILNMPCKKINSFCLKSKYDFLKKHSKKISILGVYVLTCLFIYVLMRAIFPALYKNILDLYSNIPAYFDRAINTILEWQKNANISIFEVNEINAKNAFNKFLGKIDITEFSKYAQGVIDITSGLVNFFIGIIISVYMLIDKEKIINSAKHVCDVLLGKERNALLFNVLGMVNDIFETYVYSRVIDGLIMAVLSTVVLSILRVRYAMILGVMIGAMDLIPYFGSIISSVLAVIITFFTGGIFRAIWTGVAMIILQQIDGNYIGPKIMGNMLDISPLWIIFAVTMGGGLFGVIGMVLSVPVLIVLRRILSNIIELKEQKQENDTYE